MAQLREPDGDGGDKAASAANRQALVDALTASSEAVASTITTRIVDPKVNNTRTVDRYDPPTLIEPVNA